MKKREFEFWDIIILIGALIILFWATLKALGIIHSPAWIEVLPYIGGGISIIGCAYSFGKVKRGIKETEEKVNHILKIEKRFNRLENEHQLAMEGKLKLRH